jgi:hypothetical protein
VEFDFAPVIGSAEAADTSKMSPSALRDLKPKRRVGLAPEEMRGTGSLLQGANGLRDGLQGPLL